MDTRSVTTIKIDALSRMIVMNMLSGILPIYIVTEYQKSGGTWLGQMLASYLSLPFPRNRFPVIKPSILHGHVMPTPFLKNIACVFRDGRDAIVSSYYHMLFQNDRNSPHLIQHCRSRLQFEDYDDVKNNLPRFIDYIFTEHHEKTLTRRNQFTWAEFVDAWIDREVVKVKYEDLVENGVMTMTQVLEGLTNRDVDLAKLKQVVAEFSFENQSRRKPGEEDNASFLRKGKPGDWKSKFSKEAAEVFNGYAGKQLVQLGYEADDSWINFAAD